jgi:hypothetical protein
MRRKSVLSLMKRANDLREAMISHGEDARVAFESLASAFSGRFEEERNEAVVLLDQKASGLGEVKEINERLLSLVAGVSREIKDSRGVLGLLELLEGSSSREKAEGSAIKLLARVLLGIVRLSEGKESMARLAEESFKEGALRESREHIEDRLPDEIWKFLPSNISVELDPYGRIAKIADILGNEEKDLSFKMERMSEIIKCYNIFVNRVKADIQSLDEQTRLLGIITALIMETGVRPAGDLGNSPLKVDGKIVRDTNGEVVRVDTFGAVSLRLDHIRDEGVSVLQFPGKAGTTNILDVSSHEYLVEALRSLALRATLTNQGLEVPPFLFVLSNGQRISKKMLETYFKNRIGDFAPTDFRKLKATRVVYESLRAQQRDLLSRIKSIHEEQTEDLKERVAQEIFATIEEAYLEAQKALNHEDVSTTIESYINPKIILQYLEQGRVNKTLEQAILNQPSQLTFNLNAFLQGAGIRVARLLKAFYRKQGRSLGEILDSLEESLGETTAPTSKKVGSSIQELLEDLEEEFEK